MLFIQGEEDNIAPLNQSAFQMCPRIQALPIPSFLCRVSGMMPFGLILLPMIISNKKWGKFKGDS